MFNICTKSIGLMNDGYSLVQMYLFKDCPNLLSIDRMYSIKKLEYVPVVILD